MSMPLLKEISGRTLSPLDNLKRTTKNFLNLQDALEKHMPAEFVTSAFENEVISLDTAALMTLQARLKRDMATLSAQVFPEVQQVTFPSQGLIYQSKNRLTSLFGAVHARITQSSLLRRKQMNIADYEEFLR